jgi:phosphopantothenoylcysteine decarboxylase/phosphopantothenate--cysteine ligase
MGLLKGKKILLIISGGIAAYKSLDLIRLMHKSGAEISSILTKGGEQFVTPLSISALSGKKTYTDLWSLKDETEMGHIRLAREADLILVAPASANMLAKMVAGIADDLATTTILASECPVFVAPAMNPVMWSNRATQDNMNILQTRGVISIGPCEGDMACGEYGIGRMSEPEEIITSVTAFLGKEKPLSGYKAVVTSGPTYESIDPVRFIGNRSSGKQGHAIAEALRDVGAEVSLISGPVSIDDPYGVDIVHVETANEMMEACVTLLPADIVVCAAAVGDWAPKNISINKMKKRNDEISPSIELRENPDILANIAQRSSDRPALVIGFSAETENVIDNSMVKLLKKSCDWILANDVSPKENIFGSDENHVYLITRDAHEEWKRTSKKNVASMLVSRISDHLNGKDNKDNLIIAAE